MNLLRFGFGKLALEQPGLSPAEIHHSQDGCRKGACRRLGWRGRLRHGGIRSSHGRIHFNTN